MSRRRRGWWKKAPSACHHLALAASSPVVGQHIPVAADALRHDTIHKEVLDQASYHRLENWSNENNRRKERAKVLRQFLVGLPGPCGYHRTR